jgi:hypothetical protein
MKRRAASASRTLAAPHPATEILAGHPATGPRSTAPHDGHAGGGLAATATDRSPGDLG